MTADDIARGLAVLGLEPGRPVLFHTRLSSFGHVVGGALGVIEGLARAAGPAGTLLAPTLTGRREDGPDNPPRFARDETPCWTGRVPETFRGLPGVVRSLHPTHSVAALGPLADSLARGHLEAPSPCGPGTPYARLAAEGGYVVLFGVDMNSCTLVHGTEEAAGVPYHLQEADTPVAVKAAGTVLHRRVRLHRWDDRFKDFNRLLPLVLRHGGARQGQIGDALTTVIDAGTLWVLGVATLLTDPEFLVRPDGDAGFHPAHPRPGG